VWLEKGLRQVYGFEGKITAGRWEEISACIAEHHRDPAAHIRILRQHGRYRWAIEDCYWDYGSAVGHPELFSPTVRTDQFVTCFHPDMRDHDAMNPFVNYPDAPRTDFEHFLSFVTELYTRMREAGAVAMKSATAYEIGVDYRDGDRAEAARTFCTAPKGVGPAERRNYQNTMFNWFCRLAAKLELPFQVHTGLGRLAGSNPMGLQATIERHPDVHFVLFHAGYPWTGEVAGLLHNHPNVSVDMVWAPIISTSAAVRALHEYIEVAQSSDRICWGGDTWVSEEAVGALLAWQHVLATVLAEKVDDGYFDMDEALFLAHKFMYANAERLYHLGS
jgi:hypothetical protein